jgi:hypothetical protein
MATFHLCCKVFWSVLPCFDPTIKTCDCLHSFFDSFFITCVYAIIAHHQQFFKILAMFIFSLLVTCVHSPPVCTQTIMIFQHVAMFDKQSSFLPHVVANAPHLPIYGK